MKSQLTVVALLLVLGLGCKSEGGKSFSPITKRDSAVPAKEAGADSLPDRAAGEGDAGGAAGTSGGEDAGGTGGTGGAGTLDASLSLDTAAVPDTAPAQPAPGAEKCLAYRALYCQRYIECMLLPTTDKAAAKASCEALFDRGINCQQASAVSGAYDTCMTELTRWTCVQLGQETKAYKRPASCESIIVIRFGS